MSTTLKLTPADLEWIEEQAREEPDWAYAVNLAIEARKHGIAWEKIAKRVTDLTGVYISRSGLQDRVRKETEAQRKVV